VLIQIGAAGLNPIDIAVGSGAYYGGSPPLPYVPGCEGVGRVLDAEGLPEGTRVYVFSDGLGLQRDGTMAEHAVVAEDAAIEVPEGVDDARAVACGIAGLAGWLPLSWRAPVRPDDRVLVLGATGTVGFVAVQAARVLGAARVIAAGRDGDALERARRAGADEVVRLDATDDAAESIREAAGDGGPTLVVDPLWGTPIVAALAAAARGARVVQVGAAARGEATIPSASVRGKQVEIYGYSNYAVPREVLNRAYRELVGLVAAGEIRIDEEPIPLEDVAEAWRRQAEGPHVKLVLTP
jgi:NADPH2:quinone reductase